MNYFPNPEYSDIKLLCYSYINKENNTFFKIKH